MARALIFGAGFFFFGVPSALLPYDFARKPVDRRFRILPRISRKTRFMAGFLEEPLAVQTMFYGDLR